jgi:hypothetical protein
VPALKVVPATATVRRSGVHLWERVRSLALDNYHSSEMKDCDDRGERKRLVDHLQDRHGPGLRIGDGATLDFLKQMHAERHDAREGAGRWPGGSEGPHDRNDLSSWDETKRLVTHLRCQHEPSDPDPAGSLDKIEGPHDRTDLSSWEETKQLVTNGSNPSTQTSLDKLIEFHDQHHDFMSQLYDRDDLTWKLHERDNLT